MSTYTAGSLNQLGDALENANWTAEDVTRLKQFKGLDKIKDVLYGKALIAYSDHIIDTDAQPFIPFGWDVVSHIGHGSWKLTSDLIQLFLSKDQEKNYQEGNKIRKIIEALKGKKVLNANVLDYLLAHQELIPDSWKGKLIFFWGTVYHSNIGRVCVRCLFWNGSKWDWSYYWLGDVFNSFHPAALAS